MLSARPKWNGSLSYAAPRPESPRPLFSARNPRSWLCQHVVIWPSPSFYYADPGPGRLFGKPVPTALTARLACQLTWEFSRSLVKDLVGCGIYSTRSGTDVDDIITTSLFVPLGMLNATSPTGLTCAFVSLSVVSTGCFRATKLTPIRISSSKVPYPYARIIE